MRLRLNDTSFQNYTPQLVHPEVCRHMTREECQRGDENLQRHAESLNRRQRLLQPSNSNPRGHNPNLGTIQVLVLCIVFDDHVDRPRVDVSDVEVMWNTIVPEWFDANSGGAYEIQATVTDWVVTDGSEAFYAGTNQGVISGFQKAAWPALDALDQDPDWDWSQFDSDQDGRLDSVVITHSGYGAESGETDLYRTPWEQRIWAHAWATSGEETWTSSDGSVSLSGYTVASALEGDAGTQPATMGLTVHEYMHTFGLPDLYDLKDPKEGFGIGMYDIMASPYVSKTGNVCAAQE